MKHLAYFLAVLLVLFLFTAIRRGDSGRSLFLVDLKSSAILAVQYYLVVGLIVRAFK